jgi:hypothetical protein
MFIDLWTWGTAMFHCYCVCEACCLLWPFARLIYTVCSNGLLTVLYCFVASKSVDLTLLNMD